MQQIPSCPSCCHAFGTRDSPRSHPSYVPLLLRCSHTFCERCLAKLAKNQRQGITCPVCQVVTELKEEGSVKSLWPNVYILGILAVLRKGTGAEDSLKFTAMDMFKKSQPSESVKRAEEDLRPTEVCLECSIRQATCVCTNCEANMCGNCFEKVHKSSKTLRKHQAKPLVVSEPETSNLNFCNLHDNRPIEYFCEDDHISICSHCVIKGDHKGHAITPLEDKNKEAVQELEPAVVTALSVMKRMKISQKIVSSTVPEVRAGMIKHADTIRTHFQALHAILQARELELLEDLDRACASTTTPLEDMKTHLDAKMKQLTAMVRDAQRLVSNNTQLIGNAQNLLHKLTSLDETPCFAYKVKDEAGSLKCTFDSAIGEVIRTHGLVGTNTPVVVKLLPLNQVPDEMLQAAEMAAEEAPLLPTPSPSPPADRMSLCTGPSENGTSDMDSETASETSSVRSSVRLKMPRRVRPQVVRQELVYVTHIKNPCHFMVQKCSDADRLKNLAAMINRHCNSPEANVDIPDSVEPDEMMLAKYHIDENWYRARAMNVTVDSSTTPSQLKAEVYYIDYGNVDLVPYNRLRRMKPKFCKLPEVAMRCSLIDIEPAHESGQWQLEAIQAFAGMTGDKPMVLSCKKLQNHTMYVDLSKPPADDIDDDRPVSLRDALVFMELACFTSPMSVPMSPDGKMPQPKRQFLPPESLRVRDSPDVLISHINQVDDFYVQRIGEEARYLHNVMTEIQNVYNADKVDLYTVYCPQRDMICVAKFTDDNWYRAKVVDLPGRRVVGVKYVDFGNVERVSHWNMKKIHDRFLILPIQAVNCCLADVEPVDKSKGWSKEAMALLDRYKTRQLVMFVSELLPNQKLSVVLYATSVEDDICINRALVMEGYAVSTGASSAPVLAPSPEPSDLDLAAGKAPSKRLVRGGYAGEASSYDGHVSGGGDGPGRGEGTQEENKPKAPVRLDSQMETHNVEVNVSHIVSPGELYVQRTASEDALKRMMKKLTTLYTDSPVNESPDWKEADTCAVHYAPNDSKDKLWYRGRVDGVDGDMVQVYMLDYGYKAKLSAKDLRLLDEAEEDFQDACYSICCHFADLQPAGDISKWSRTACEYLAEELADQQIFIALKDETKDGSLPIDLLIPEVIKGDALTSDTIHFNSMAQKLKDRGLALAVRRSKTPPQKITVPEFLTRPPPAPVPTVKELEEDLAEAAGQTDTSVQFAPPTPPERSHVVAVPTFVDYDCVIHFQEVKDEEDSDGRYGYILKEHTLEVMMQDAHFARLGLMRARIPRDGNCLFRAFAEGVLHNQDVCHEVRQNAVETIRNNWTMFQQVLVDKDMEAYTLQMAQDACYGGEPEMHALCSSYGVYINIFHGGLEFPIQTRKYGSTAKTGVTLSFVCDGEYDSGHYDLVVKDPDEAQRVERRYQEWRQERVRLLRSTPSSIDQNSYDESILQRLMDRLQTLYKDSSPDPDAEWHVGQAVIAQYTDNLFYRGRITAIGEKGISVFYVDFGNTEVMQNGRLRSKVSLADIPAQCLQCEIPNMLPNTKDGRWPTKYLEYIHNMVVGQTCSIHILEPPRVGETLQVEITLPTGQDVFNTVTSLGLTRTVDPMEAAGFSSNSVSNAIPAREVPERVVPSPYKPLQVPRPEGVMLVSVTEVERPDRVYLQYLPQAKATDPGLVLINDQLSTLASLSTVFHGDHRNYPLLKDVKPGMACCGQYTRDGCWYRAEVIAVDSEHDDVAVVYVDYGNSEYVTRDRIRQLPNKFLELPAQGVQCLLSGVEEPADKPWNPSSSGYMTEALIGKQLISVVKSIDESNITPLLTVELYEHSRYLKEGSEAPLVYQWLVDRGIVHYHRRGSQGSVIIEGTYDDDDIPSPTPSQGNATGATFPSSPPPADTNALSAKNSSTKTTAESSDSDTGGLQNLTELTKNLSWGALVDKELPMEEV